MPPTTKLIAAAATLALSCIQNLLAQDPIAVQERFFTNIDEANNVDSIAVWRVPSSEQRLLISTAKASHKLIVYDAQNGFPISEYGSPGAALGQFQRPNGIAVEDDIVFVVERDNHRIQALRLPDFTPLGTFGEQQLVKPYGIYIRPVEGGYQVYVSDDYNPAPGGEPEPNPDGLRQRIKRFQIQIESDALQTEFLNAFGAHAGGPAALDVVESLMGDPAHDRLLIADEDFENGMEIHVYDLEGADTGQTLGKGLFQFQPEGIALWTTGRKSGYWIFTDQGEEANHYHIFDRRSLAHLTSFQGERTLNTDGIAIDLAPSPRYPRGLFYAIHDDSGVAAWSLADIAKATGLRP